MGDDSIEERRELWRVRVKTLRRDLRQARKRLAEIEAQLRNRRNNLPSPR